MSALQQFKISNLKFKICGRGFTLIELMITVSIIAIIAAIGMVSYSQAQKLARDSRRKQDLQAIAIALEIYRQKNNRYPCTGDNTWVYSPASAPWISDTDGDPGCADTVDKPLNTTYIPRVPIDPINSGGNPWQSNTGYTYGYRGYSSSLCSTKNGQFYMLVAQLENKSDPDRNQIRQVKDCDAIAPTGTGWDTSYILTSD